MYGQIRYLVNFEMIPFPFSAQARITDIAKLEGKLDSENAARKSEIAALDSWAKGENDARKTEIENLGRIRFNSILSTRKSHSILISDLSPRNWLDTDVQNYCVRGWEWDMQANSGMLSGVN